MANELVLCLVQSKGRAMQYKDTKKIVIDQRKLEVLFRLGCPDTQIIQMLRTGKHDPTGDTLIDDTLDCLLDHKTFNNNNWGGARKGAGAPKGNTNAKKNNQVNQENNQENNQDTDKDIDIYNNSRVENKLLETTRANKPTLIEVIEYAKQQDQMAGVGGFKCTPETAERFWTYYESINWRIGNEARTPITNWKAKLRHWAIKDALGEPPPRETEKERKARENHEKLEELIRKSKEAQEKDKK